MADWLTKADLQNFVNTLPDDAVICPHCCSRMNLYVTDEGYAYSCPNLMCLYEENIPQETVMQAQS